MNRQVKKAVFFLLMTGQIVWWIKVVFTEDNFKDFQEPEKRRSVRDASQPNQLELESNQKDSRNLPIVVARETPHRYVKYFNPINKLIKYREKEKVDSLNLKEPLISANEVFGKYYNKLLGHTILPRNSSVVTQGEYSKNPVDLCTRHSDLDLLIIVHTAPYNFRRRTMIRQTMANNDNIRPYTVQAAFFIGDMVMAKRESVKEVLLNEEFRKHGDLIQMSFDEDFRNLSLKAVMWLKWTNDHCQNAFMILKIDDDVTLDIFKVLPLSRGLFSKYKRSIFCNVNRVGSQPIPRIGRTKVDPREFVHVVNYPYVYCSGFIVFLTPDLIPLLAQTVQRVPFYNVDDVFMFGMVPKFIGHVTYHNLGYNLSIWHEKVYNCTVTLGKDCGYFGTMSENEEYRQRLWQAMAMSHDQEFHFPTIKLP